MNQCGCCRGISVVTPQPEANRPGLPALTYRVGTYPTFFESMVARLSNLYLDITAPGSTAIQRLYPLTKLTTRELSDPSIALLDSWAIVADILTFYQQRIANEGFLQTATERLSLVELADLIGYKPRPGVAASVFLAFTAAKSFDGTIPAGTRAQSIPGTGQTAQYFETSADLTARDTWNKLGARLTRPQIITLKVDLGTDAATRDTIYFGGVSTNLKSGDMLLFVLGNDNGQQVSRFVETVQAQPDQKRTEVTLQQAPLQQGTSAANTTSAALQPFIDQATSIFDNSDLANTVASVLTTLIENVATASGNQAASDMIRAAIPQIAEQHDIARRRNFSRLEPWTADILTAMYSLVNLVAELDGQSAGSGQTSIAVSSLAPSALENLFAITASLSRPVSLQPLNGQRLARSVKQTFSSQSDTAPRLLAAFKPAIAPTIYQAWSGISTPSPQPQVYAFRVKAAPFGSNAPQRPVIPAIGSATNYLEWSLSTDDEGSFISLDTTYDKVVNGSWIVVDSPDRADGPLITQVNHVQSISRADYGLAARVTQVNVNANWLPLTPAVGITETQPNITALRRVTIWAQPELLDLAEEPLDTDIEGNNIELDGLYDGFESGRWLIVSGERTDIPNTTGVTASEAVMISSVSQGTNAPLCAKFPAGYIPFAQVFYTTDANSQGDRLVVGKLQGNLSYGRLQQVPSPSYPNQQFCQQTQLAPGLYVNAYVPTTAERSGQFPAFQGLLIDPLTHQAFPNGEIPATILGSVFAWRISSAAVYTTFTLANALSYKYDRTSITLYGNVTKATHGQTVGEVLGDGKASEPFQQFELSQSPLTYVSAVTPEGTQSSLVVRVNDLAWNEADDLPSLGPTDHGYVVETDDKNQTSVIFGNGAHGARVPTGTANIKATYRYGIGASGNVDALQISQLATFPQGAQGVINPLAAAGGADPDTVDDLRRNAPVALLALDRLVSVSDYADFTRTYAGIGKASSVKLSDGRKQVVHVTVAGANDIPIDPTSDLYQNLIQSLHKFGDPYLPVQVALRKLKLLIISARVKIQSAYLWEDVESRVRTALLAGFSFNSRNLGQPAFLSEAIGIMQAIPGVSYVDTRIFDSVNEDSTAAQIAGLGDTLGLNNAVGANLAQVNPLSTSPASRILPAELAILTPAIPDTLILTQVTA